MENTGGKAKTGKLSAVFNALAASFHRNRLGTTLGAISIAVGLLIHDPLAIAFGAAAIGFAVVSAFTKEPKPEAQADEAKNCAAGLKASGILLHFPTKKAEGPRR